MDNYLQEITRFLKKIEKRVFAEKDIFENYTFFKILNKKLFYEIKPIKNPQIISFDDIICIESIKEIVLQNTLKFISLGIANNVLLWGERGCGKSSLIRSIVFKLKDKNVKLIQLKKTDLLILEILIDILSEFENKFIIMLDDLSFKEEDDLFLHLKYVLDESSFQKNKNIIIYATSNKRHLIEEKFIPADILHEEDKLNEIISLSDRFGLTIGFYKFTKNQYIKIVNHYAKKFNLQNEINIQEALNFAMKKGGYTGRNAYQYILSII